MQSDPTTTKRKLQMQPKAKNEPYPRQSKLLVISQLRKNITDIMSMIVRHEVKLSEKSAASANPTELTRVGELSREESPFLPPTRQATIANSQAAGKTQQIKQKLFLQWKRSGQTSQPATPAATQLCSCAPSLKKAILVIIQVTTRL